MNIITIIIFIIIIIIIYVFFKKEYFNNEDQKIAYLFFSHSCPHCVTYKKNSLDSVKQKCAENNITVIVIDSGNDPEGLFQKHNIQFVPAGIVMKNSKSSKVDGMLSYENIKQSLDKL